ncbi:T9SS type A sorting domain-containing protein [Crocinitomix algicola]|uniref:T9SS type A sorting domain-containing protein n=1 Tax=Crocinitomix algicola TaxID=1740263 RepID=UPI000834C5DF|nr:T9SS type A sorting domain-containing protein [Crocinitomix algicola]
MKFKLTLAVFLFAVVAVAQPAGELDPTFGDEGKILQSINVGEDKAYGVALQDDNKVVVIGSTFDAATGLDFLLIRFNEDGSLDTDFGEEGIVQTDVQFGSSDVAYDVVIQGDGKIILAGSSDDGVDQNAALVRYHTDGTIDADFGTDGVVLTDFDEGKSDEIRVVKIHALTGNIIVGGSAIISSTKSKPVVARYLSDGSLDESFETDGIRLLWIDDLDYQYLFSVEDLAVTSAGKITAVGWRDFPDLSWDSDYWAGRINADGTMDPTFSSDGVNVYNGAFNGHDRAYGLILNPDNSFFIAGGGYIETLRYDETLIEINESGSVGDDYAIADYGSWYNDIAYSLANDSEGRFILAGSTKNDDEAEFTITRFTSGFELDADFGSGGKVTTTFGSNDFNESFDMLIQPDNKIIAVGYSGNDVAIARYLGEDTPELNEFILQTPAAGATNQNYASLAFNWTNAFGATGYEFEFDTSPDFTDAPEVYTPVSSAYTVTDLLPDTEYFWRVRATDGDVWGDYSEVWSFTTNSLDNFNLVSPANGATDQSESSLDLDWTTAVGALEYEVQYALNPTFTESPVTFTTGSSNYTLTGLALETLYYWRVRATNDGDNFGDWTSAWNFTTASDVGIDDWSADNLKVYPNPSNGVFYVEFSELALGEVYQIMDVTGKIVVEGDVNQIIIPFDIQLNKGVYFLQLKNNPKSLIKLTIQ